MDGFGTFLMHRHREFARTRIRRWLRLAGVCVLNLLAALLMIALLVWLFYLAPILDALMLLGSAP